MIVPQAYPQTKQELTGDTEIGDIEVVLPDEDGAEIDDASAAAAKTEDEIYDDFYKNIAEDLDEDILGEIAEEVAELYQNDLDSREEWEKTYENGVKLLGLNIEDRSEPWEGACGVFHPLMAEAAIRFQAESITELFKAQGICKSTIVGKSDPIREKAAKRVENDMNWRITTQMKEYRPEHERMLWNLAIMGSAFKKVYYDPSLGRQTSVFVSAEDLVAPYGATDIFTTPRLSHRMKKTLNDIKKLQVAGFYRDVDLEEPIQGAAVSKRSATDKIKGTVAVKDDRLDLIEMHVDLEIEGYEDMGSDGEETGIMLPFVVTFDRQSKEILSIYRNWKIDDEHKQRVQHFVHYVYIPGFGFYGMGLVHLVGGFANSATSILRQLVDAGTLANLPAGYKTKGIRIQRDANPLEPGEFRDVDVPSGTLRDNLLPLPFKEPSQTLLQLFGEIVEEGRRMAAVSDLNAADMNQEAPVGTTLAILERSLKVMSAIQARLHAALKEELALLKDIIKDQLPDEYDYEVDDETRMVKKEDYDHAEIIPVSDPNAATMSQRVVQYQAVMQMAQGSPQMYDQVELHRQMLETLGIRNVAKLIPASADQTPKDPISENVAMLTGKPVKAFAYQDHEAHLRAHMAAKNDPQIAKLMGQDPNAQLVMSAVNAHIADHIAQEYRKRVEQQLGSPLPQGDEKMTPETEKQLSVVLAQAAQQVLQQHQTQSAQEAAQQAAQDPVLQAQQAQLKIEQEKNRISEKKVDNEFKIAMARFTSDAGKVDEVHNHEKEMQANQMIVDAAKFDAEQQGQGVNPEMENATKQQEMHHAQQQHELGLTHQHQQHRQKLGHQQEIHAEKVKQAQQQRLVQAAIQAAQPHLKGEE